AQGCCGAIDFHGGDPQRALERARINLEAFQALAVDHVVVNAAGCGAMLKEYDHLAKYDETLKSALNGFAHQVRDVHEVLSLLGPLPDLSPLPIRVVYQDACHLRHAQKIEQEPRKLLLQIPQLQLLAIAEPNICCGAAGSYNLTEPEMSDRLGQRKIEAILKQNPDVIASGNVGCSLQLQSLLRQRGLSIPVLHPVELIDMSQRGLTVEQYLAEVG
ncbi:MAG: hypothetical protein KDA78_18805, partial [Planctomycetaceae bacterium]|nr:hypothetical protein [Planctomycetaceae bacterium]